MEPDNRRLMQELREDHRNMAMVLDVLADTLGEAKADKDPDFELVEEIMRYMTVYPDAVHHPKEDLVYAQLQSLHPDLAEGLEDVAKDHQEIADLGTALRDDVEAIIAGAAVRREHFVTDCERYVLRLRDHMQWEEDDLFKRIDTMIAEDEPATDLERFIHIKDPVFELEIEPVFRRLMASLKSAQKYQAS